MNKYRDINVLGTTYQIFTDVAENEMPEYSDGVVDFTTKTIKVINMVKDRNSVENLESYKSKVILHEVIHAFLYESGLDINSSSSWAVNEEMIDWIAIQLPKIFEVYKKLITIEG